MLFIQKENCPAGIQAQIDALIRGEEWDNIPEKPSMEQAHFIRKEYFDKLRKYPIRESLISEQHGLCAYCMDRVKNSGESTSIEHLIPLSESKAGAMDYQNWLAVCMGGENIVPAQGKKRVMCCDRQKKNKITKLNPFNKSQMDRIAYYGDGTIFYDALSEKEQKDINREINKYYGLNGEVDPKTGHSREDTTTGIVKKRKDAYIAMCELMRDWKKDGILTKDLVDRYRQSLLSDEFWEPFVGVMLYVLEKFPNVDCEMD